MPSAGELPGEGPAGCRGGEAQAGEASPPGLRYPGQPGPVSFASQVGQGALVAIVFILKARNVVSEA